MALKITQRLHSPWLMWFVTILFVLFQFFLQLSAGVMVEQLSESFKLTSFGAGFIASSFYLIYVILQTPAGIVVDRLGPRRLLGWGGVICALGCYVFASSSSPLVAFLGRLMMGGGASFAFVSSLYLVGKWFPVTRFAFMVGLTEAVGMVGALIGNVYLATLLQHVSWRTTMYVFSGVALVLALLCYAIVRDKPEDADDEPFKDASDFYRDVKWLLKHPRLWFNGMYAGLMFSLVTVFAALWGLPFLQLTQHVNLPVATLENSMMFVGIAIGSPIIGSLYSRILDQRYILVIAALLSAVFASMVIYETPHSIALSIFLFLMLGFCCSSYVLNFSLANDMVPKHIRSTSIGLTNTICLASAPLLQPLIGWFLHVLASSHHHFGLIDYSVSNYHWALSILPLALVAAALIGVKLPKVGER